MRRDPDIELDRIEEEARSLQASLFPQLSKNYVPGEGVTRGAEAFVIGEAPGAQEDIAKRPFVGPCRVVRDLMGLAGLHVTENAWLTNVVKFRPPGNRNPTNAEVKTFRKLLQDEWHAVGEPTLIIPVGGVALSAIFGKAMPILRHAGRNRRLRSAYTGKILNIWPMCHPSFGLRGGEALQNLIEEDWLKLKAWRDAQHH